MTGRLAACLIVVFACSSTWVDVASAQSKSSSSPEKAAVDVRARELFQKGDTAYAEGRYEEALAAFQEAFDLSNRPQLLFNVSNALERLGRYAEAVDALERYLASGKAKDRDVVQKRLANLRKRVDDQKKADDRAKDDDDKRKADEKKKADAEAADAAKKAAAQNDAAKPPPPPPEKPTRILPIVLLGGGGLALTTSAFFGVLTLGARSDVKAGCKDTAAGRLCTSDTSGAIDRDKTFGLVTDIALISGVVLGGVGAYFLIAGGGGGSSSVDDKGAVKVGAQVSTDRAGVQIVGTF